MKIGMVIHMVEIPQIGRAFSYKEMRNMARRAEDLGLDSIWLYDHFLYRREGEPTIGIWECWTILSALAAATRRVELGTLVACTSFRNPAILAKMAATLDEVSQGRLVLGLGAGWNKPEFDSFGIPFDHRVSRFEEALQIIKPLLREGKVDFQGKFYQARDCEIRPRGPRPEGPPLLIGGFGPKMLRLTARYADMWNTGYLNSLDQLEKPRQALISACQEEGRNPTTLDVTVMGYLGFPDLIDPKIIPENALIGTTEEVAAALKKFANAGVSHMMFHLVPSIPKAINRLAAAVEKFRS